MVYYVKSKLIFSAAKPRSRHRANGEGWWAILDGKHSNILEQLSDEHHHFSQIVFI